MIPVGARKVNVFEDAITMSAVNRAGVAAHVKVPAHGDVLRGGTHGALKTTTVPICGVLVMSMPGVPTGPAHTTVTGPPPTTAYAGLDIVVPTSRDNAATAAIAARITVCFITLLN